MKLLQLGRALSERAKNLGLLGTVAAVSIYGYANAIAPTVAIDRDFQGSVNIAIQLGEPTATVPVYTVPAGRQYTLTDVVMANTQSTPSFGRVYISSASNCAFPVMRLNDVAIPPTSTVHIPFVTGLGFGPGKTMCLTTTGNIAYTLRGYLSSD